ncbi:MAG TPA: hypothetical protein VNO30_18280 [Kofleriaceae bacterium]|nr:hypothetical protein [Kofleriaceae bacterium]
MSAPSTRSTRSPKSRRTESSTRSKRGSTAVASSARSPESSASTCDLSGTRSAAPDLNETTRGDDRDRARDLAPLESGLDHRGSRRGIRNSTRGAARTHHRGMATRPTLPPERDRFLASVGALRDWINDVGREATWRIALASLFWCVSTQVPLPNDTALARALLFVSAVTIGALAGRRLDRRKRRKPRCVAASSASPSGNRSVRVSASKRSSGG